MARRRPKSKKQAKPTLLLVGEGKLDTMFLKYLKSLYAKESPYAITVHSGDGGSPAMVIHTAIKRKDITYDNKYVMIDSDIDLTDSDKHKAKKGKVNIIQSEPLCLEGMLLQVLGHKPTNSNDECKSQLYNLIKCKLDDLNCLKRHFPKDMLDNTQVSTIVELRQLLLKQ